MEARGLTGEGLFATNQLKDGCGYIAYNAAVEMRRLGRAFDQLTMDQVQAFNTPQWISHSNQELAMGYSTEAELLSGDNIIELCSINNPDAPGDAPSWLSAVGPINHFEEYFARTLIDPTEHGIVHMMIVNTEPVFTQSVDMSMPTPGTHWFLAAWCIDPEGGPECGAAGM